MPIARFRLAPVLACVLLGCGASARQQVLVEFLGNAPARTGTDWCSTHAVEQEASAASRQYLTQQFVVHRWRSEPPDDAVPIPEADVFDALEQSRLGLTLLVAPPGQGKTRFAQALEARLCGTMPILRLDVAGEFVSRMRGAGQDAVADQLARQLQLKPGDEQADFRKLLEDARWVLVVDSLHEVPPADRDAVVQNLKALVARNPRHLQVVVMARPDLMNAEPGILPFDTVLEIPPLDCVRTDAAVDSILRGQAPRFWQWLARFGLDRKETGPGGRCSFRHLTTFRSVHAAVAVARTMGLDGTDAQFQAGLQSPRAPVVQRLAQALVAHDLKPLKIDPQVVLPILTAAADTHPTAVLASGVPFTQASCVAAAKGKVSDPSETCRRLLDTALFVRVTNQGPWQLAGPPFGDLLRAQVLADRIARDGCEVVGKSALVVTEGDTAGLLVGLPAGGKCLGEVASVTCTAVGVEPAAQQLAFGLPRGSARTQALATAKGEGCAAQVLEKLR